MQSLTPFPTPDRYVVYKPRVINWDEPSALNDYSVNDTTTPIVYKADSPRGLGGIATLPLEAMLSALCRICVQSELKPNGCMEHKYTPTKPGGYGQISISGTKYTVHVLTYATSKRQYRSDWPVSHLCSNAQCANPSHLVQEPQGVNESRKNCITNSTWLMCPHKPKCIGHTRT